MPGAPVRVALRAAAERLHRRASRIGDPNLRRSFLDEVPENSRTVQLARAAGL